MQSFILALKTGRAISVEEVNALESVLGKYQSKITERTHRSFMVLEGDRENVNKMVEELEIWNVSDNRTISIFTAQKKVKRNRDE